MGASDLIDLPWSKWDYHPGLQMVQILPTDGTELVLSEHDMGTLTSPDTDTRLFYCREEPVFPLKQNDLTRDSSRQMKLNYLRTKPYFPRERIISPFSQIITGEY